jgi:ketosteroid isomerase-like protein
MSQENVEIVRQGFETYNRRGVRAVAQDYWHQNIEWELGPWAVPLGGQTHLRGREQVIAAFDELESILGGFEVEVIDVAEGREEVLAEVRLRGEGAESRAAVDQRFWYAIRFEGSRQRRIRLFRDRAEALAAVGLRE